MPPLRAQICVPSPAFGEGTQGAQQGGAKAPCAVVQQPVSILLKML